VKVRSLKIEEREDPETGEPYDRLKAKIGDDSASARLHVRSYQFDKFDAFENEAVVTIVKAVAFYKKNKIRLELDDLSSVSREEFDLGYINKEDSLTDI